MELLVEHGAKLNLRTDAAATPLHYAASFDRSGAVKVLCEAGAKVNLKDNQGRTPLALTRSVDAMEVLEKLGAIR